MKKIVLSTLILLLSFGLQAQEKDTTVNKSLIITRNYTPNIDKSNKVLTMPKQTEWVIKKRVPRYSNLTVPIVNKYNVHTLATKELKHQLTQKYKGFARVGAGNPMNTIADIFYPIYDENNRFDFSFNHLGAFRDKIHSDTKAQLNYNHLFDSFELYTTVGAKHDYFNYYGRMFEGNRLIDINIPNIHPMDIYTTPENKTVNFNDILWQKGHNNHYRVNARVGARSLSLSQSFRYDVELSYNLFQMQMNQVNEHQSHFKGLLEKKIMSNKNYFGAELEVFNFIYHTNNVNFTHLNNHDYTLIKVNPYYTIKGEKGYLKLGAKAGFSIGKGKKFAPSPDIHFKWNPIPLYLSIYGGVTGDVKANSLNKIYSENIYLAPQNRVEDTYIPIDTYLGVKVSPVNHLIFDVFGGYKMISNPYFYTNREYKSSYKNSVYSNRFDVVSTNDPAHKITTGIHLLWNYFDKVSFYAKGSYNHWILDNSVAYAWHLPEWESNFGMSLKVGNRIKLNSQLIFEDGRYVLQDNQVKTLQSIVDLNVGASYQYFDWVSFFVKANNILDKKYPIFNGYDAQGFNLLGGVSFSF